MVRQWQTLFYNERYSNTDLKDGHGTVRIPDFVKLGEAYGCATFRCERDEDVDATIKAALKSTTALSSLTSLSAPRPCLAHGPGRRI